MSKLENMKKRYDESAIPEELNIRIQQEIMKSRRQQGEKDSVCKRNRMKK